MAFFIGSHLTLCLIQNNTVKCVYLEEYHCQFVVINSYWVLKITFLLPLS